MICCFYLFFDFLCLSSLFGSFAESTPMLQRQCLKWLMENSDLRNCMKLEVQITIFSLGRMVSNQTNWQCLFCIVLAQLTATYDLYSMLSRARKVRAAVSNCLAASRTVSRLLVAFMGLFFVKLSLPALFTIILQSILDSILFFCSCSSMFGSCSQEAMKTAQR